MVPFRLFMDASKEDIVPLTSLCHPICVVPNFGAKNLDDYLLILPKGEWSQYFTRFIHKTNQMSNSITCPSMIYYKYN